jgi:mono/diheme cytochrome c family protein
MRKPSWKTLVIEGWAFVGVAAIAFVGGLLIGGLASSPKTETVVVTSSNEGKEAEAPEAPEATGAEEGAQVFTSEGCGSCHTFKAANSTGTIGPDLNEYLAPDDDRAGIEEMIVDPNAEIAEGYSANVMPQDYGQSISKKELERLVQFLIENSPAGGTKSEGPGGEENDVGGPSN